MPARRPIVAAAMLAAAVVGLTAHAALSQQGKLQGPRLAAVAPASPSGAARPTRAPPATPVSL
jgi:hypothetical protein